VADPPSQAGQHDASARQFDALRRGDAALLLLFHACRLGCFSDWIDAAPGLQ
jgi:hypothetical protein